ncbi:MAG: hypothetical protein M1837_006939 [Sclerophora amabilis]|nr:MAG: hypothetical protein M1837_006939 [Sclerophora amabilis]
MPRPPARLRNLGHDDREDPALEGNIAQRRTAHAERRRCKIERRRLVLRQEVVPNRSEVRDVLHCRICSEGVQLLGMPVEDALLSAREMLQWRNIDGVVPLAIVSDQDIIDFITAIFDQNWRCELKPPPALVEREEPKVSKVLVGKLLHDCPESEGAAKRRKQQEREEGRDLDPKPTPKQRTKGQPVYLQFHQNEVVLSFLLQDSSSRAVSFRWVELNPGLNLQDEMVRITIEVDNAEQAYISQYNRIMLVHLARWRLWKQYGDPIEIAAADEREAPVAPNQPRCLQPFFKGTQAITFGEKMCQAITNRGLDRLPENIYGQNVVNNPIAYFPPEDDHESTYSGITDMEE